jgi:hypothetical protein
VSAALEPEPDPLTAAPAGRSVTASRVEALAHRLPSVDLGTLDAAAALLTRTDRKYVVPIATFERLLDGLNGWRALEIDGRRLFGYTSTYFDTLDLATYRAHLQGRRRRFKVRVRQYVDSGDCLLEVKRKGLRGVTVKERAAHQAWRRFELGPDGHAFVAEVLRGHAPFPDSELEPVVTTSNGRATLVHLGSRSRLTVDVDLRCGWGERSTVLRDGFVVIESKVGGHASEVDRLLRGLGERPVTISKYCLGVASLGLDVPSNPWRRSLRRYFESPTSEELSCP